MIAFIFIAGFGIMAFVVLGFFLRSRVSGFQDRGPATGPAPALRRGKATAAQRRERVEQAVGASAVAADEEPWFAADAVVADAAELYRRTQAAWDARDEEALAFDVGPDLLIEWQRRLDDFAAKGWHSRVSIVSGPVVEYVGIANREGTEEDQVVVRISAVLRDVVETADGQVLLQQGADRETVATAEYWTLRRFEDRWFVDRIEQDAEGEHHLDAPLVTAPWSDDQRLSDATVLERAAADAVPEHVSPGELVDVDLAGDALAQALDLSLVDERFAPHVLEVSARRALDAWVEAVDGDDAPLEAVADSVAVEALLYAGDPTRRTRLVVRGARLLSAEIVALDPHATPATIALAAQVEGRRYVEDRDTLAVLSGSREDEITFDVRWTLVLDEDDGVPWRLAAAQGVA